MPKKYELKRSQKLGNRIVAFQAKRGKGSAWKLTTTGRKSGERRSVMVSPITVDGSEYLVAPYGPVSWVLNLRASDRATLTHGSTTSRVRAVEVAGEEAGKVLTKYYHEHTKYVADYFDLAANPTIVDFTRIAHLHPVFRIEHPM